MHSTLELITSDALEVRHGFFTRKGGASSGVFSGLNCGTGSSDQTEIVAINRARVAEAMGLGPEALVTVHQVHSARAIPVTGPLSIRPEADALVTDRPGVLLAVLTADCQPVLFADPDARVVGAAHAGWRGAVTGVLEATIEAMLAIGARRARIIAAVGPCIRQPSYEVAADLRDAVLARDPADARFFAEGRREDRWQFDLAGYCAARLSAAGATVEVTPHDTLADEANFFSHRRNTLAKGGPIGHQLSAIALTA